MKSKYPRPKPLWKLYIGPFAVLAIVGLFPAIAHGRYEYLLDLGATCGINVIIVCGLTLLMGYTGQVSLGHAGFFALGAYIPAVLVDSFHWPLLPAISVGIAATALIGLLIGGSILRLKGNHLALATLAVGMIIYQGISKFRITNGSDGITGLPALFHLNGPISKLYLIWGVVMVCIIWAIQLCDSPGGRSLRAIQGDESAAASLGINPFAVKVKIFVASCVLAAVAGVLHAFVRSDGYLEPEAFNLMFNVQLVMMVVIGGMGSIWGSVAGGVLLTVLHELIGLVGHAMGLADTSRIEHLVFGILLGLVLILMPAGVVPGLKRGALRVGSIGNRKSQIVNRT
jgi:branched-chain amino acid transport system permease protein